MSTEPLLRRRFRWLGTAALGAAVLFAVLEVVAIVVGSDQHWATATIMADAVIVLTAVSLLGGVIAVILDRGRRLGIAAIVLSLVANPLVQIAVLGIFGRS